MRLYCQGSVEPGARADLMLCPGTLNEVLGELCSQRVRLVLVGGRVVSERS